MSKAIRVLLKKSDIIGKVPLPTDLEFEESAFHMKIWRM